MKFTDRFFEMPVRAYDEKSLIKSLSQELNPPEEEEEKVEGTTYIEVLIKVPAQYLSDITWTESFLCENMDKAIERERKRRGFGLNATEVCVHKTGEKYLCTLSKAQFEQALNDFMDTYDQTKDSH